MYLQCNLGKVGEDENVIGMTTVMLLAGVVEAGKLMETSRWLAMKILSLAALSISCSNNPAKPPSWDCCRFPASNLDLPLALARAMEHMTR